MGTSRFAGQRLLADPAEFDNHGKEHLRYSDWFSPFLQPEIEAVMTRYLSRRRFLTSSAAGIAASTFLAGAPAFLRGRDLNNKLNIAAIGVGGRGGGNLGSV